MKIVIVDYGMGNLRSVEKAFQRLGCAAEISSHPATIATAERLVLPGVGNFARGMENLRARSLLPALESSVRERGVPLLGICLGMQLLSRRSEEGDAEGLGWIDAETVRLSPPAGSSLRVPHYGWNSLRLAQSSSFVPGELDGASFYFAHAYHLGRCPPAHVVGWTTFGVEFPSVIRSGNLIGIQFHPEKSHRRGLALLRAFVDNT